MASLQMLGGPDHGAAAITEITALPSGTRYTPTADTDAARGVSLASALSAFASSSDTVLRVPEGYTFEISSAITFTPTGAKTIRGRRSTIRAASGTDFNFLLKVVNNTNEQVEFDGVHLNHANLLRTAGVGDTLYLSGSGPIAWRNSTIRNGPHDSNTNPATPSPDGSLVRWEGSGPKRLENVWLVDPAYASFRGHGDTMTFDHVVSAVYNLKPGAYQRHGYLDSEAVNANVELFRWSRGGVIDRVAHKVNLNLDPSSDGPHWANNIIFEDLFFDISTNHLNSDSDSFVKIHYCRNFRMSRCVQRHANIDTVVSGTYTDNVNTSSLESFLNLGAVGFALIEGNRLDGNIKGIGSSSTQGGTCIVRNNEFGANAYIDYCMSNVSNFQYVEWDSNRCYNVYGGGTGAARCCFDLEGGTRGQTIRITGENYIQTRWPTVSGQAGGIFRHIDSRVGHVIVERPILIEAVAGTMATVAAFTEEQRLLATATDECTLHLERNIIQGGAQTGLGDGTGVYVATQQAPTTQTTTNTNMFAQFSGVDGAVIVNDNWGPGGNGHPRRIIWTGTIWTPEEPYIEAAGDPTTTEWPNSGDTGLHRNTSSGALYLVRNVGGTIKKVAMT